MNARPHWPCVLKLAESDELQFIESKDEWLSNGCYSEAHYGADDRLIDSSGQAFALAGEFGSTLCRGSVAAVLDLPQVVQLVRRHASLCGECCVSKLGAPSIAIALQLVEDLG